MRTKTLAIEISPNFYIFVEWTSLAEGALPSREHSFNPHAVSPTSFSLFLHSFKPRPYLTIISFSIHCEYHHTIRTRKYLTAQCARPPSVPPLRKTMLYPTPNSSTTRCWWLYAIEHLLHLIFHVATRLCSNGRISWDDKCCTETTRNPEVHTLANARTRFDARAQVGLVWLETMFSLVPDILSRSNAFAI